MRWLLDSNVWIEAAAGVSHASNALAKAAAADWCGYSSISRLEVFGFPKLSAVEENGLQVLLSQFHEIPVSGEVIDTAIQLRRQVRMKSPDAIVAASALLEKADLVTRNVADFQKIPGLKVVDSTTI
jgi:predicted nucleic acid-binding protein